MIKILFDNARKLHALNLILYSDFIKENKKLNDEQFKYFLKHYLEPFCASPKDGLARIKVTQQLKIVLSEEQIKIFDSILKLKGDSL